MDNILKALLGIVDVKEEVIVQCNIKEISNKLENIAVLDTLASQLIDVNQNMQNRVNDIAELLRPMLNELKERKYYDNIHLKQTCSEIEAVLGWMIVVAKPKYISHRIL